MVEVHQKYPTLAELMEELKRITDIGFPIAAMSLVGYLKNMILVVCMGRLGSLELAGGALAIGFTNISGYSVLSGLATGMESLCGQAFGSKNLLVASLTLRRTIMMLLFASVPIGLIWINLEPIMLSINQDSGITKVASLYCRFAIPDLIANSLLQPLRIYLRSKGMTWPLMWSAFFSTVFHLPITIVLTFYLRLGVPGIAISTFITSFNTLFFLLCYMFYNRSTTSTDSDESVLMPLSPPPSSTALMGREWGVLLRLSIPSCISVCLEWWWYEFMTILTGNLSEPSVGLATSAIVIQTTSLMYTLPTALSASASTRVGNELGAGRPTRAKLAAMVAIGLALVTSFFGLIGTILGRQAWGRVFTKDNQVLELTMTVLPIIGLCELANCPQTTSCGILRGSARPGIGATINFYSFYMVGAPLAVVLGFVWGLGFVGLCYGLLAAQIACVVSILTVVFKTDWEKESLKANDLVAKSDPFAHADPTLLTKC
ncbi:Lipoamide acyltransferase component of branched-chain alpha-keto acid dehydrogenase isoform 1 [Hibiscus syriacus]|uniref:Protein DETOXIFICATION n=1 Tax=Hibiscus syriacus TaxID=106335 RepID=A0A6A3CUV3_HIBSY|nr:protein DETOXIFICATION 55-like [Hibiscus syriacus]KAE8730931.1 Lipoamide acyltransferase component of branched-chain alpha-keto acid dehydrogenase isoform 1 [Hibiscus syriacus]